METQSENILDTISIGKLLEFTFKIPAYQRGYRWRAKTQVKELLEDIWSYEIDYSNEDAYYCLQPVVVKHQQNQTFELIDGQQRLTTILLILHVFNETEFKRPKKHYDIEFETRPQLQNFLKKIKDFGVASRDIDLFHLHEAYAFIDKWFEEMENIESTSIRSDFYSKLINKTKVIWYEIKDNTSVIDIFSRLNIGKIPLTNAELIKALFLSKSGDSTDIESKHLKQINIASEWDRIEQTLQSEEFWHFICPVSDRYATRIEFIFDLMKDRKGDDERYFTFHQFNQQFDELKDNPKAIDKIWKEVKNYFLTFEEWYKDRETYHLIGYLTAAGTKISAIKEDAEGVPKSQLKKKLKSKALGTIKSNFDELNFHNKKNEIRNVLLLFNILSILKNAKSYLRFPFHYYHKQSWDLEHIRSQNIKDIGIKDQYLWAKSVLWYFTGQEWDLTDKKHLVSHIDSLNEQEKGYCNDLVRILEGVDDSSVFTSLYDRLSKFFKENNELKGDDSIANLTLLDQRTNRMYKDAFFPVKRKHIINQEKRGVFIPLCTKNVFLKAYSQKLGEVMYWNKDDAHDYLAEIKNTLGL